MIIKLDEFSAIAIGSYNLNKFLLNFQ